MDVLLEYILPLVRNIAICVFVRMCCETEDGGSIPRFYCLLLLIMAIVPILSWIALIVAISTILGVACGGDLFLKRNRFTDFWFRS